MTRIYDYRLLTVAQLRDQLRIHKLPLGGRKAELIDRLEAVRPTVAKRG